MTRPSDKTWLAICLLSIVSGFLAGALTGWNARGNTVRDRYLLSLAERHEAEANYFNRKLDTMMDTNRKELKRGAKKD